MASVKKGVIPAAGWGTRFLPVTKAVPKEMLPVLDRPMIQYTVEEASSSGIQHLTIVLSRFKESMANYFDHVPELEAILEAKGDGQMLQEVRRVSNLIEISYVRQQEQLGLGHAVLMTRHSLGQEPFAVFLPDDIIVSEEPEMARLMAAFDRFGGSVVGITEVHPDEIHNYGVIDGELIEEGIFRIRGLVEKPRRKDAPSGLGIVGRYVFTPGIFDALAEVSPGALGEVQLTDAMALLAQREPMYACLLKGRRHDVGNPFGMLKASVDLMLHREDMRSQTLDWLRGMVDQ